MTQFNLTLLESDRLRADYIALIGMAGAGKSYWSKRLEQECGFTRFCIDDRIKQLLEEQTPLQEHPLQLGRWLGFPYQQHFAERERKYLALEESALCESLAAIEQRRARFNDNSHPHLSQDRSLESGPVVVDTTGSVIYLSPPELSRLKQLSLLVYIETAPERIQMMLDDYLHHPRPIIWNGSFHRLTGESDTQALSRCYLELVAERQLRYKSMADIVVSQRELADRHLTGASLLALIRTRLPAKLSKKPLSEGLRRE